MKQNNFSDTLVEEYDLFGKVFPFHDELQQTVAEELAKKFPQQLMVGGKGLTMLDIGAGYGFTSALVAKKFPAAKLLMNDFDAEMLNKATEIVAASNFEKLPGDIEEVIKNIPSQSVDAVYTAWVLHNFSPAKRRIVIAEIARILKPGGIFVNLEKVGNAGSERTSELAQAILDLAPFHTQYNKADLYIEWVKHDLRDEESDRLFSMDENEKWLAENGLTWECVKHILLERVIVATKQ